MERFTKRAGGRAFFPECFKEPCEGMGCKRGAECEFINRVCERLCELEDKLESGVLHEDKQGRWKLVSESGFFRRSQLSWRCSECGTESVMNGKESRCTACGAIMNGAGRERHAE